jgi:alkylation response protein AidB-like acyl-CoA dehydrogenase
MNRQLRDLSEGRFREVFRVYLAEHDPGRPKDFDGRLEWLRRFARQLADDGFAAPSWPLEFGGMDLALGSQFVYHEELAIARLQAHPTSTAWIVGPTLIKHGATWQQERFLRPMLRADEIWCQGFSEPDAGSDLPSLKTRAVRDGDEYVVSGQKVWTSDAVNSDWTFALVRTGAPDSGASGISFLLIDLKSPGVIIRPLREMTGHARFSEMFFDEVRVPVENRVGDEGGGWRIARTSLGHERSTAFVGSAVRYRRVVNDLLSLAKSNGACRSPQLRQELADIEIRIRLLELNGRRVMTNLAVTGEPGPTSSVSRLFYGQFEKRLHEVAMDVLGAEALLGQESPQNGRWIWGFLATRAATIGAGTAEIQRNTIGERVLGLPRESE